MLKGHTRMQLTQDPPFAAQKLRHFSALMGHRQRPSLLEILLMSVVGKDGGFIMDSATVIDDAKPENVRAMLDFTKEYGAYGEVLVERCSL